MHWWPLYGLFHRLTERRRYESPVGVEGMGPTFRRSLFVYPLDLGNDNALNLEIAALKSPHYSPHRFGIFFAATPRHADVLILLGNLLPPLKEAFRIALDQVPRPFGALWIREPDAFGTEEVRNLVEEAGGRLIATIDGLEGPQGIIGALRGAMQGGRT